MSAPKLYHLEEHESCRWFLKCPRKTDMTLDHPILGQVPVCQQCLTIVGFDDIAGWRFIVTDTAGQTEPAFFMHPDRDAARDNVRLNYIRWNKTKSISSIEWTESIPKNQGWGIGAKWTEGFKKNES